VAERVVKQHQVEKILIEMQHLVIKIGVQEVVECVTTMAHLVLVVQATPLSYFRHPFLSPHPTFLNHIMDL
jgi:hypothetical protein